MSLPDVQGVLSEVGRACAIAVRDGRLPVVIFDLDDTLFHNSPRSFRIFLDLLKGDQEATSSYTEQFRAMALRALESIGPMGFDYAVAASLTANGAPEGPELERLMEGWRSRFFTDRYLDQDRPVEGAVETVRNLHGSGCVVCYVSGRHVGGMLQGTVRAMEAHGFPVGRAGTELVLKPAQEIEDDVFKRDVCVYLAKRGPIVSVFDNDPRQLNSYLDAFPGAIGVWMKTRIPPGSPPPHPRARVLRDFRST